MKPRLTRRQAWLLKSVAGAWMPIMYGRDDRRVTDGLVRLGLATANDEGYLNPASKKAWSLTPTMLGRAFGCLLSRRTGGKLRRSGVASLARHRKQLLEHFDVEGSVTNLLAERNHLAEINFYRAMKGASSV